MSQALCGTVWSFLEKEYLAQPKTELGPMSFTWMGKLR